MEVEKVNLKDLSVDILVRIFDYLNVKDLKSIALCCKRLNRIVSNESKILDHFEIFWTHESGEKEFIGGRKYQKILIGDCLEDTFMECFKTFKKFTESLSELTIQMIEQIQIVNLKRFLNIFENLTKLTLVELNLFNFQEVCDDKNLPQFKNLEFLDFSYNDFEILKIFSRAKLKILIISNDCGDVRILKDFLVHQNSLESFEVSYYDNNSELFDDERILEVKFKLKVLKIDENKIKSSVVKKFIDLHEKSLEKLEINSANFHILRHFVEFKKLKSIKLTGSDNYDNFEACLPQIETLNLQCAVRNFSTIFPHTRTLKIHSVEIDYSEIMELKNLENLEIRNLTNIPVLPSKNIKNLTFIDCTFDSNKELSFRKNKLKKLVIKSCTNIDWLKSFLRNRHQKLKTLEILDMKSSENELSEGVVKAIGDYGGNIRNLAVPR